MNLELFRPVKPFFLNQSFGGNPEYYSRFHDRFGQPNRGHNGIDLQAPHGTPVYAACDGWVHFEKDSHGGEGMIIKTAQLEYNGQPATYNVINWHLCGDTDPKYPSPFRTDGNPYQVKAGQIIGHADNTGAPFESSGDHLHFGLCPFDLQGNAIEAHNGFNGCIDPTPYFNNYYAVDAETVIEDLDQELTLAQKVVALLRSLIGK